MIPGISSIGVYPIAVFDVDYATPSPLQALLADPDADLVWTLTLDAMPLAGDTLPYAFGTIPIAALADEGGVYSFFFADRMFQTGPTEDPPNLNFSARLIEPWNFETNLPVPGGDGTEGAGGVATAGYGAIRIANGDGALDPLLRDYTLLGRTFEVHVGGTLDRGRAAERTLLWEEFGLVARGTIASVEADRDAVTLAIFDPARKLERPALRDLYATPVEPVGLYRFEDGEPLPDGVTLTRASAGTYTRADGTVEAFATDEARIGDRGLLHEEERTNSLLRSRELGTSWTLSNATAGTDAATAPDGTTTADKLIETVATGAHLAVQAVTKAAEAQAWGWGVVVEPDGRSAMRLLMYGSSTANGVRADFDLALGEIIGGAAGTLGNFLDGTAGIEPLGTTGQFFVWVAGTTNADSVVRFRMDLRDGSGNSYTGDGSSGVYVWNMQGERGARPSSLIETEGSAATRAADVAVVDLADGDYDILVRREGSAAWHAATTAGSAGWTIPVDMDDPFIREILVFAAGALTDEDAALLLAGGEFTDESVAGLPVPMAYGALFNVPALLVRSADLLYQVSGGPIEAVSAVRDKGVPLDFAADHATFGDLLATTVAGGEYATCRAEGLIRVGGQPEGQITVDLQGDNDGGYAETAPDIARRIAVRVGGLSDPTDIDAAAFASVATNAPVGIWLPPETVTVADALRDLMTSIDGWYGFTRAGLLTVGQHLAPEDQVADVILDDTRIVVGSLKARDDRAPAWRQRIGWRRMTTTQNADALHAGVTAADRALYGREHRVALASDPTVADLHALARDVERPTLLAEAADAEAEALRLLDRDAVIRRTYECEVTRGMLRFRVGEVVRVRVDAPRVGLPEDGKNLVILGLAETAASDRVRLVLWG